MSAPSRADIVEALAEIRRQRVTIVVHPDDRTEALDALVAEFDGVELVVSRVIGEPGKAFVIRPGAFPPMTAEVYPL